MEDNILLTLPVYFGQDRLGELRSIYLVFEMLSVNFICFFFSFGSKHVTPRSLSARFIGNMVCVEGIITKCKSREPYDLQWSFCVNLPNYSGLILPPKK